MTKTKNPVWRFFASVHLALMVLIILAITSIIGTLIQQKKTPDFYVEEYGETLARFFEMLDIPRMYSSWWFVTLLSLFAINLVVCSIERLPAVWHMVRRDNLATDPEQLEKMSSTHRAESRLLPGAAGDRIQQLLVGEGWKAPQRLDLENSTLLFVQKGAWTRLGVYVVHLSILVILVGAMIGTLFGYQGYVFLPEGKSTSHIFLRDTKTPAPLGFKLRCDRFEMSHYPNGMVKQYRSDLTVLDSERGTNYQKSIIVNDPLSYRGFTFYQGDAYPMEEYLVVISNRTKGIEQAFRVPPGKDVAWQGTDLSFRIADLQRGEDNAVQQARISISKTNAKASTFWVEQKDSLPIRYAGEEIVVSFRQLYSSLLLITKDPGVLTVYAGCILMVLGLAVSFFLSHRRLWVLITPQHKQGSRILVSGVSNKNKPGFERQFQKLVAGLGQDVAETEVKPKKQDTRRRYKRPDTRSKS